MQISWEINYSGRGGKELIIRLTQVLTTWQPNRDNAVQTKLETVDDNLKRLDEGIQSIENRQKANDLMDKDKEQSKREKQKGN